MNKKVFRKLVSIGEAKERLNGHFIAEPVGIEEVSLDNGLGRVLAEDVEAKIDVPSFDRASMDGFAVHAENTFGAEEERPVNLKIIGRIGAGEIAKINVDEGETVEISTGAPIPKGANAVVMVEYTWQKAGFLNVYRSVAPGENIMAAGSDIMMGELILRRGDFLTPRETGVLAALGVTRLVVFKKPHVAVISTGNEVVIPGTPLEFGKIYDINSRSISDSIIECGGIPQFLGVVGDEGSAIQTKIKEGLQTADAVILSGGTSAGFGDLLYRIIDDIGKPGILVHGVSVKPGKPLIIAVVNGKPIFGLPGYPTSALTMFNVFLSPIIRKMAGLQANPQRKRVGAKAAQKIESPLGRHEYLPVNLVKTENEKYMVYPLPGTSGAITTLFEADGFIEIPLNQTFIDEGEPVVVELFNFELKSSDMTIIGSHCVGIDLLLRRLRRKYIGLIIKVINTGSSGGLAAIRRGEADIAGTHLIDEKTGTYNLPFLERFGILDRSILVRGYVREQGLIVERNNPKKIHTIKDIIDGQFSIINRNLGSGTRILLDRHLRNLAISQDKTFNELVLDIKGYRTEAKSHSAVAMAVLHRKVDVGIGLRAVAERYNLGFIHIADESYDFIINRTSWNKPIVQAFLDILRSSEFKSELQQVLPGIKPTEETGKIIHPQDLK